MNAETMWKSLEETCDILEDYAEGNADPHEALGEIMRVMYEAEHHD